jgi:hypothetical protein
MMVFTADTAKPSSHAIANKICPPSHLCIILIFISKLWQNIYEMVRFSFQMHVYHQPWGRTWKYILTSENKDYKLSEEMFTWHRTQGNCEGAAPRPSRLYSLAHHIFRMFCVGIFRKLHASQKFFYVSRIYICREPFVLTLLTPLL